MSLFKRLVVACFAIVVVLVVAMVVVVSGQRGHLEGQVDGELSKIGLLGPVPADLNFPPPVLEPDEVFISSEIFEGPAEMVDPPISDVFVAVADSHDSIVVVFEGGLLDDAPDLRSLQLAELQPGSGRTIETVPGVKASTRFRVSVEPLVAGEWSVVALPLADVDDAIRQLTLSLLVGSGLVLAALALAVGWVVRLGLRPMGEMTHAAGEIAAGQRDVRVDYDDQRTEVGRLGAALNEMLDRRDQSENRLRQFAADASHELRTPLTSIRGGLDLLADNDLPETQRADVVRRVRSESHRMHDLVEDLLLLASIDSGRPLRSDPIDLVPVVQDAAADARALQPGRSIQVEIADPSADGEPRPASVMVTGDELRLRQVLAGLVHNALTHTPSDAELRLGVRSAGGDVMVWVADDGPGMEAPDARAVFDRFSRGDASRSRNAGGAGLGLSIAKSIVEAHQGTLTVDTSPGEGCTFTIRLDALPQ